MLTPAQVIPFLGHDDPDVRRQARRYLVSAHDPAPATAEDFWAAADKLGPDDSGAYLDRLGFVPQTDASVRRLVGELPKADPATRDSLLRTLERLDLPLLRAHWDAIQGSEAVSPTLRDHLRARLALADEPAEPLWDRTMAYAAALEDRDITEPEELEADRLIEALARHPETFGPRVLAALSDPDVGGWRELFCVDVAGEMRLADATHALLDKIKDDDDGDLLWDVAADALVRIGDAGVVDAIAERFGRDGWGFQLSTANVLGRIKRPESQAALMRLLPAEGDLGVVAAIVSALVDLCPTDAETMETLRAIARSDGYDRMTIHLDEELLSLSTMTGYELPEAAEWRKRIAENRSRWAMGMSNVDQLITRSESLLPSSLHAAPLMPAPARRGGGGGGRGGAAAAAAQRQARPARGPLPFRNATPKVGRNDPCPCGSGKKHKKCCGR
jgi:hypothetical protein